MASKTEIDLSNYPPIPDDLKNQVAAGFLIMKEVKGELVFIDKQTGENSRKVDKKGNWYAWRGETEEIGPKTYTPKAKTYTRCKGGMTKEGKPCKRSSIRGACKGGKTQEGEPCKLGQEKEITRTPKAMKGIERKKPYTRGAGWQLVQAAPKKD